MKLPQFPNPSEGGRCGKRVGILKCLEIEVVALDRAYSKVWVEHKEWSNRKRQGAWVGQTSDDRKVNLGC